MHPCRPAHPPRPRPPRPAAPQGFLMQRIIACEKRCVNDLWAEWCFESCHEGCIQSVSVSGAPVWHAENGCTLHLSVPVTVRLCDSCGHCFTQTACVELETDLPHSFLCGMNDARHTLLILPCVQLLHAEKACSGCFRVRLSVTLEVFLLRYEVLSCGSCQPQCPQLPLYPPPMC